MTDPGQLPGRRYNEKEVADIIKRASELQQLESTAESTAGMSLAELEQVAREAGLDPALVRRAATDMDTRVSDRKPSAFIGAPTHLVLERTIDGEVPVGRVRDARARDAAGARRRGPGVDAGTLARVDDAGRPSRRGVSTRTIQVTVTPRNGRTTIRIEEPLGQLAGGLFGGLMGGLGGGSSGIAMGIGMGVFHSAAIAHGIDRRDGDGELPAGAHDLRPHGAQPRGADAAADVAPRRARRRDGRAHPEVSRPAERPALGRDG